MAQGFDFTDGEEFDVILTYSAAQQTVSAVDVAPGWQVLGSFRPTQDTTARLDVTGAVTSGILTMTVRIYELDGVDSGGVGTAVTITSTSPVAVTASQSTQLDAGKLYQIQAQVVGSPLADEFGVINSVQLIP